MLAWLRKVLFGETTQPRHSADLEERLVKLETGVKNIRLEWESTYEKFHTLLARFARREQRAAEASNSPAEAGSATGGTSPRHEIKNPAARRLLGMRD